MKSKRISLIQVLTITISLLISIQMLGQAGQTLSFTVTNGPEERCAVDSTVTIGITPNPDFTFTRITINWGDGSDRTIIEPGQPLERSHNYPGPDFLQQCDYDGECILDGFNGFCFLIEVVAQYQNTDERENASKRLTFQTPPRPNFSVSPTLVCQNNSISFMNNTCPGNDPNMTYTWTVDGNAPLTEEEIAHIFSSSGSFPVTLMAKNKCGETSITKDIQVQELPISVPVLDSGSISIDNDIYRVCLGEGGFVRLNGDGSIAANSFRWTISPSNGSSWGSADTRNDTTRLYFDSPGRYTITLEVDNGCNEPNTASFEVDVFDSSSLTLEKQLDQCLSLNYTPTPLDANATYSIDGQVVNNSDFPRSLEARSAPYLIEAVLPDLCGDIVKRDTFRVFAPTIPSLVTPSQDTSICATDSRLLLQADPPGGTWVHERIIHEGEDYYFDLSGPGGTFTVEYRFGSGDCERSTQVNINIDEVSVDIGPDVENLCLDDGDFNLAASPTGGIWSGTGIIDPSGVFNPAEAGEGSHEITYTYTDVNNGCRVERKKTIVVSRIPEISIADSTATCLVDAAINLADLTGMTVNPVGGTFNWSGIGVVDAIAGTYNPAILGTEGVDTILLTYTSPAGCMAMATTHLRIDDLVTAQTLGDTVLCLGNESSLTLPSEPSGGSWQGLGIDRLTGTIDLNQISGGTVEYCYTIQAETPCESRACVNITFVEGGAVNAGEDVYACETTPTIQLTNGIPTNGQWSGPNLSNSNEIDVSSLTVGEHIYTFTVPSLPAACNSDQLSLFIDSLPQPNISLDSIGCVGEQLSITASSSNAGSWEWDLGDGNIKTGESIEHEYSVAGNYQISLTANSLHPTSATQVCSNTIPASIFINQAPERVSFDLDNGEDCGPLSVNFTNTSLGDLLNFQWDFGNGDTSTLQQPGTILFPAGIADTTYRIQLSVDNGCGGSIALDSVRVKAPAKARFGTRTASYCSGERFTVVNTSYGNPDSYYWDLGNNNTSTDSMPPEVFYLTDTTFQQPILLIVENECNADTLIREVTINPTNVTAFFFTEKTEVCAGEEICFENLSTFNVEVQYDFGDGNSSTSFNPCHIFTEPGEFWVRIQAFGCGFDQDSVLITVNPAPNPTFEVPDRACINSPILVQNQMSSGVNFRWFSADSLLSTVKNPSLILTRTGMSELVLEVENQFGCIQSTSRLLDIIAPPEAIAMIDTDSICVGNSVSLTHVPQEGLTSCLWDFNNGITSSNCDTTLTFLTGGIKNIDLIVGNELNCKDTNRISLFVVEVPTPTFQFEPVELCNPTEIRFLNSSELGDSFYWDFGDGNNSTAINPIHIYREPGTYSVQLTAFRDGICPATTEAFISVAETPDASFRVSDTLSCSPKEIEFTVNQPGSDLQYFWHLGQGTYVYDSTFSHLFQSAGTYEIQLVVTNVNSGCSDTSSQTVQLFTPPVLSYSTVDNICFGEENGEIDIEISQGSPSYQIDWADNSPDSDRRNLPAGLYPLIITDANNCKAAANIEIIEPPSISIEKIDEAIVSCSGGTDGYLEVEAQGGKGPYSYQWSNNSTDNFILNVAAGEYQLTVTDSLSCEYVEAFAVDENPPIILNEEIAPIVCFGDKNASVSLNPQGGVAPYFASLEPTG